KTEAPAEAKTEAPAAPVKRPGAKKAAPKAEAPKAEAEAAKAEAPKPEAPKAEAESKPEPAKPSNGEHGSSKPPAQPVKGLGIARGARPPGKR
uniref:hypothetical protein n=1 Tax=Mycobacterium avium TaxID=1764 RepID=UPI00191C8526